VTSSVLLWALLAFLPQSSTCTDLASCRQAALDAEARQDFEAFHDLAWKAASRAKPNDPESMRLLARAQSLSGRPGDALVMLRRLADMGIAPDVSGDEFRRVRALPGWPAVEALLAEVRERRVADRDPPAAADPAAPAARAPGAPRTGPTTRAAPADRPGDPAAPAARTATAGAASSPGAKTTAPIATAPAAAPKVLTLPAPAPMAAAVDAVRLSGDDIDPIGLAYDSASRRFVLVDRGDNRLVVADEVFKRVNPLIGAGSGGFGELTALEVDRQRGDLWVTSEGDKGRAAVHKLQLVSGRVLSRLDVPEKWGPAVIGDVAVSGNGSIVLLDREGSRLLILPQPGHAFSRAIPLLATSPSSVAAAGSVAYVSHEGGLLRADLQSGTVRKIVASGKVTLAGLRRIRWHGGTLIAIQQLAGARGVVRLGFNTAGTAVTTAARLDDERPGEGAALTIAGDTAYYVAREAGAPVIRRVPLR
jgi:hypothetical protein